MNLSSAQLLLKGLNLKNTILPLALFTVFFIINAVLGYYAIKNIADNQSEVNQSLANINYINELYLEVLRGETGQRGFLLTDLEEYGEPYQAAVNNIEAKLADLSNATLDSEQQSRAYELQVLILEKMAELERTVLAIRENRDREAIQMVFTHRGKDLMSEITLISRTMESHERILLSQRQGIAEESRVTAFYLILTSNLVGVLMVFVSLSLVRKGQQKDTEYALSLQLANDTLEEKVEERTRALEHFSIELKRSNRELQDFAFVASHDLQEPLRKIRAFGDRLQSNFSDQLGEQGQDYIQRMQNASLRMSTLINDLLTFSRITTKAKEFIPVNLQTVLDEVLDDLEVSIEESGASIEADELPEIEADFSQMKQLFQNLIGNAIKFHRENIKPEISIHVRKIYSDTTLSDEEQTELLELRFVDNGVGFDERFVDRIFMPFQRLHGKSEFQGTGIGLSVCRRIVERHQGKIQAKSQLNKGSEFIIQLPIVRQTFKIEDQVNS